MSIQDTTEYKALRRALRGQGMVEVALQGGTAEFTSSGRFVETSWGGYHEDTEPRLILALPVEQAEALLVALAVNEKSKLIKLLAAALLGDIPGSPNLPILREFIYTRGKGSDDIRCASLIAIARRIMAAGGEAGDLTDIFVEIFLGKDTSAVHDYASGCLAAVGDDRAWTPIYERLVHQMRTGTGTAEARQSILAHLARNSAGHPDRIETLRSLVERFWPKLDHEWVGTYLPGLAPTTQREPGQPDPDFPEIGRWGRKMVFLSTRYDDEDGA